MRRVLAVSIAAFVVLGATTPVHAARGDNMIIGDRNYTSCLYPPCGGVGDGTTTRLEGSADNSILEIVNTYSGSQFGNARGVHISVGWSASTPNTRGLSVFSGGTAVEADSFTGIAVDAWSHRTTAVQARGGSATAAAITSINRAGGSALRADSTAGEAAIQAYGWNDAEAVDARSNTAAPTVTGQNWGAGIGVLGKSPSLGAMGEATAERGTGVYGFAGRGNGVAGRSSAPALGVDGIYAAGIFAENTADDGIGLWARNLNSSGGVGIFTEAYGADALALHARGTTKLQGKTVHEGTTAHRGVVQFQRSGVVTVPAGSTSVARTGIGLTASSFVIATIQGNVAGVHVQGVTTDPAARTIRVHLNRAAPSNVRVGWFLIN